MDMYKRQLLQKYQQDIIDDLDVAYIYDELFAKHVISAEEYNLIRSISARIEQTRLLLELLIRNGTNESYQAFVDSLKKDYSWLWEKFDMKNNNPMPDDFEDSLSRGDVPRLPDHHVRRTKVEQHVAECLRGLQRHKVLALHGMSGSGKTCVVVSTLRDNRDLVTTNFNGAVFWLSFGNCKTDDDIIFQQSKLLRKTSSMYTQNSYMNSSVSMSSIGSNGDSQSSSIDWTMDELRDKLKVQFYEQPLKECLLVLDEVNDKKCLEAFDIGCKILVTTRDTSVVASYSAQIIKIENSLEERESLEIFALSLEVPVSKLPWQAKKIHELCKGSPFNIGLIGAQLAENRERLLDDPKRWNYYVKELKKENHFSFIPIKQKYDPMKTIEVCINSLNQNVLPLFKKLKILPKNVKISTKVLSKLWNKEISQVESIMKELRSKSLIIEVYDREQRNYMYEIHDLIMKYLTSTGEDDNKKLHEEFLSRYHYNTENPPLEIIDDGYIAFYIGYHIKHTDNYKDMWTLFNKLFLNLKFLGNKVRLTGPADVISDLKNYENYILRYELDQELINNTKAFLSTHGNDLFHYPCTDIIQSILQNESKGILYSKASQIAQDNCNNNELYFDFLHEQNVDEIKHSTIDVKEKITAVCFLRDYVLVGTNSGMIKFFNIVTNKQGKELRGTGSPIKWIGVSLTKNPPMVAALAYDGVIKLWYVDDLEYEENEDVIEEEPEECYNNTFADVQIQGSYLNCRWSNNEEYLIMHTSKKIEFYDPSRSERNKIFRTIMDFDRDREILCCIPCNYDKNVIVATDGPVKRVEVIDLKTKERINTFEETDIVLDMVTVPRSNKIITLKPNEIMEHEMSRPHAGAIKNTCCCRRVITSSDIKDNLYFIAMAVNKTGTLLCVATDDSRVVCIDLKTYTKCFDLENRRGNVVAMAMSEMMYDEFEPGSDVLLTGTGSIEDSAKVWYLDASYISRMNGRVRLTTKFDVSFLHPLSPQTPNSPSPNNNSESVHTTPKRHQSFNLREAQPKMVLKNSMSLDRSALKPLNLKGICNNNDGVLQPLLAVVDDQNNIQVMRGRKVLTEITERSDKSESITRVKISPCNQYIIYGLKSGIVKKYTLRTKETVPIMDVYSPVQYLNFVDPNLLIVAGKNTCLMAYKLTANGDWKPEMMRRGNNSLGSQEILNDIQGIPKKNGYSEKLSSSSSETSLSSQGRIFRSEEYKNLCKGSCLVECFSVPDLGIITVESNATIKLWSKNLNVETILIGRQPDVYITSAALQNNVLVICDKKNSTFQTFELKIDDGVKLQIIEDYRLNNVIVSCDLTSDGNILALGLDSGNVVVWNVRARRQLCLLKHHKSKVHSCSFSPVPERANRNSMTSSPHLTPYHLSTSQDDDVDTEQPPLVLVTMATEIVWWNITHVMKTQKFKLGKRNYNVMTPLGSPLERSCETPNTSLDNSTSFASPNSPKRNFFFGDGDFLPQQCWKALWKGKTCKQGSKRKEILACIKLSGMHAKRLSHDEKFSCFVTVDNPGHIHIMNVMRSNHK
ncbi:apoptotic protease-activating factor 1 [Spodoptera frugiperda]|uniref:Apoptotic protease-activating factor 1 n=1 Tax=Spodoptera frugiperda TaxID=7108 RepID=A0A9R0EDU3_SPOFR|nr:apoptotic protease-activating factor 1 [Spodoptera frugiperda]XP_050563211.1 apoptotic protease-activating factor 1 [Spodoptera frugiperda]XP_050563212.1 apoptotic protease-activating factor 1 [Spodoptera frugiperda]